MKIKEITRKFFSVQKFKISDRLTSYQILLVCLFLFAYLIRTMYGWLELPDYWGDSYHHFYIIKATLQNGFVYSDYKTNNFLWLPGIHYLGLGFLLLFGGNSLVTLHLMNRIIGAFSAILVADIVYKVFKNQYLAMISSFTVILSPWHILYSNMFMPEPWAGVCLLLMVWGWVSNSEFAFQLGWFLGIISRYENWIFGLLLLMFLLFITRAREKRRIMLSLSVLACWIVIWSTWSLIGQSDGLFWFKSQFSAISGDRSYYATLNSLDLFLRISFSWIGYLIGFIGALTYIISIGIRKVIEKRLIEETLDEEESNKKLLTVDQFLLVIIGLIIIRIILILIFDLIPINDPRFLLIDLHLVGLLVPSWIIAYQHFKESIKLISPNSFFIKTKSIKRTNLFGSIFVFLIFFSHFWSQLPVMVNQAYIVTPEKEAGLFLQAYITSKYSSQFTPKIFIDSPVVAYYANLEVHQMISSEWIDIFNPLNTLITTNIRILVLHDVPYSKGYSYFNFLTANPAFITKEKTNFTRIFQYDGWELQYGAKPVVIYWLDHS